MTSLGTVKVSKRSAAAIAESARVTLSTPRNQRPLRRSPRHISASRVLLCQAPAGGISARSGTTCGKATCKVKYIDSSDVIQQYQVNGSDVEIEVFNWAGTAVGASSYIKATQEQASGKWTIISEDCP